MINKIKYLVLALSFLMSAVGAPALAASPTTEDTLFAACQGAGKDSAICREKLTNDANKNPNPIFHVIKVAADIVAVVTGAVAVIMIIFGGISMVVSAGNPEAVKNSRRRITFALVGLVIVALAWTIISFVTDRLIK